MICISLFARIIGITGLFVQYGLAIPSPTVQNEPRTDTSLSSFLSSESPIALKGILDNIGPDGAKVPGAGTGLVIASPSRTNPNCKPHVLISMFSSSFFKDWLRIAQRPCLHLSSCYAEFAF